MTWTLAAARIDETPRKRSILAALRGLASGLGRMRSTTCYSDARANQTLDQTGAIVQRHGESTSPPLISFVVPPALTRPFVVVILLV